MTDRATDVLRELLAEVDAEERRFDERVHLTGEQENALEARVAALWERARTVVEGEEQGKCPFACSECGVYCEREASDPEHASSSHGAWCHCPGTWETTDSAAPPLVAATPESAPTCSRCGQPWPTHPLATCSPSTTTEPMGAEPIRIGPDPTDELEDALADLQRKFPRSERT
jgi:hypothetical protein